MNLIHKSLASIAAICVALLATSTSNALAQTVSVTDPWVRATVAQQRASGAFMTLTAPTTMKLVGARSPVAAIVEIHEMAMVGDMMKMRAIPSLDLPQGKGVSLAPGGYHVMLIDLKAQIKEGDAVPITLIFEGADGKQVTQELSAKARPLTSRSGGSMHHSMDGAMDKGAKGHKH